MVDRFIYVSCYNDSGYISVVLFGNSKELFRLYDFLHAHVMFRLIILSMLLLY